MTGDKVSSGEVSGERPIRESNMIKSRFLKFPRNNARGIEVVDEPSQEEKGSYGQELL